MASVRQIASAGWRYAKNGTPSKVLEFEKFRIPFKPASNDVVVKMVAAPVHKHDKSVIEGHYGPVRSKANTAFPAVAGVEGVGVVEEVGTAAGVGVQAGDLVWVNNQSVGTWASHIVTPSQNLDVVPNRADLEIEYLASLSLFHTAYQLSHSFVKLQPGDVVLQTGSSGAVAQICQSYIRARGAKLFQTMREGRSNDKYLRNMSKSRGAYGVVPYNYAESSYMRRLLSDLPPPKLPLNGVGGPRASRLIQLLGNNGTMVTYGNASGRPMQISAVDQITRNLTFKNFFLPQWIASTSREVRMVQTQNIVETMALAQGHAAFRAQRFKLDTDAPFAFADAFDASLNGRKPVLRMVGEYGEWRRPDNFYASESVTKAVWEDVLQETVESTAASDQPQSMKYYTPFGNFYSDFKDAESSREAGYREVFFKRPNAPRNNASESTT